MRLVCSLPKGAFGPVIGQRKSFVGDAIINLAGNSLARAITLASMAVVTGIYAPAHLGVWAIVLTLSGFLVPLATLRYDLAVVIAPTPRMAAALVLVTGASSLVVAAVVAFALFMAPRQLLEAISGLGSDRQALLALVPFVLVLLAAQAMLQAWLTREREFGAVSLVQVVQATVTAAATLLLPLVAGASAATVAAGAMLGFSVGVVVTMGFCGREIACFADRRLKSVIRSAFRRFKVYPCYLVPYTLSSGLAERVIQVVLAGAYSLSALGAFYVARQLVMALARLIVEPLRQVNFAHAAGKVDAAHTKARVGRILRMLIHGQAACLGFGLFWMAPVVTALTGASWARLADFAWWIMFPASTYLLIGWLDRMLDVLGRQRLAVVLQLGSDVVLMGIAISSPGIGLGEVGMVAALSLGTATIDLIKLAVTLDLLRFRPSEILALAARACGLCLLWSGMQLGIATFVPGPTGLVLASLLLVASLAPLGVELAPRFRSAREVRRLAGGGE
jgi:O-antigen/teichoic acid export membrane protein